MESVVIREQKLVIGVNKRFAKPYVQKIKNIIWSQVDSTCEVESHSFDTDETMIITLYFLCTVKQRERLDEILTTRFVGESLKKID